MTREERKLRKHVDAHARYEGRKVQKQAAAIRKAGEIKRPRPRLDLRTTDWEDFEDPGDIPAFEPGRPLAARRKPEPASTPGLVLGIGPGACQVLSRAEPVHCRLLPGLAVGDRVLLSKRGIEEILPRTTVLSRPDPHNPHVERVIAANIDAVVIVASARAPAFRPGLVDRYLIAIERSGAEPVLCVNKIDLLEAGEQLSDLAPYHDLGLAIVRCSANTGHGLDLFLERLAGKLCVLVGHSGVGKSSLLNALHPELALATGAVSEANQKGRHTTSSSRLYEIPNGPSIIDTPGIREFGLWDVSPGELRRHFHEFDAHAGACAFADCTHTHEPDCAVKQAVEAGVIPMARYRAYCRILQQDKLPAGPS